MELFIKTFSQLTALELYAIQRVRQEVFVVEQNCPYLDADGIDIVATHLFFKDERPEGSNILAYARLYWEESQDNCVKIGRVLSARRKEGWGLNILEEAVKFTLGYYRPEEILIHAQEYAVPFYEKVGFVPEGQRFLEDNIPHMLMKIKI